MQARSGRQAETPWFALAVGSLVLAGAFALFLVVARVPPFSQVLGAPEFFKRCLVVHVDLSIVVWFHAFTAGLFALLPATSVWNPVRQTGAALALGGVGLVFASIAIEGATPILSNYVPSLDHPIFYAGMGAFFVGVALSFLDGRLLPWNESDAPSLLPPQARPGVRAAALAFLFATLTFAGSALSTPAGLTPDVRAEFIFWGGGHVLQVSSVASMLSVWILLLTQSLGAAPVSRKTASALFAALVVPTAAAPVMALWGATRVEVHDGFTKLMQWGIFPVVTVFMVLCGRAVILAVRRGDVAAWHPKLLAFYASVLLTVVGFVLGALIRGSNTMVPAHYHAAIGAVTVSFMAATYAVFEHRRLPQPSAFLARASRWQPVLFGVGQAVFAAGFALAGSQGMARKTYASEQHIRTSLETVGLVVMGLGGLVAVASGLLFLAWVLKARWMSDPERTASWQVQSIPFKP